MMLQPRKREVEVLVDLLEREHADVDALAFEVMRVSFDLLTKRELWVVVTVYPDAFWLHGPFFTRKQAEKALITTTINPMAPDARVAIRRLITATASGDDSE